MKLYFRLVHARHISCDECAYNVPARTVNTIGIDECGRLEKTRTDLDKCFNYKSFKKL